MRKSFHGILIALVLALALALPVGALAATVLGPEVTDSPQLNEGITTGGEVYYNANGQTVSDEDDAVVTMSKTIEPSRDEHGNMVENEFIITLNVRTQQKLLQISSGTPDAAVLLVMDVSNSMDDCVHCGLENGNNVHGYTIVDACPGSNGSQTYERQRNSWYNICRHCGNYQSQHVDIEVPGSCTYEARLAVTQASAKQFLHQFANQTGAQDDDKRMVAIVAYGTHAVTDLNWVNVRTQAGMDAAEDAIDDLTIANSGRRTGSSWNSDSLQGGGTSIESGLALARNLLTDGRKQGGAINGIDYLYTIMLTDGQPTYGSAEPNATRTTYITGSTSGSGSSTESSDYNDVAGIAQSIKGVNSLSKLYSICIGKVVNGNNTTQVWDQTLYGNTTVGTWLKGFSTEAYHGDDASTAKLFDSFNSVLSQIQLATRAWKVEDWMGDHMVFEGAVAVPNGSGTLSNHVTYNLSASDYENGNTPEFLWDLLSSQYDDSSTYNENTKTGTLSYTYKYKVRLCNLDKTYTAGQDLAANAKATLRYVATNADGSWPTEYQTASFPVPQVKGLAGTVQFQKLGKDNAPLQGIKFRLRLNYDPDCEGNQPHFQYAEATSDSNGIVTFNNIPSGHAYTLLEEGVPDGYLDPGDHAVTVTWGDVDIAKPNGDLLIDSGNDRVVEFHNTPITKTPGQITLQKTFAEGSVKPASIAFTIEGANSSYYAQRSLYPSDKVTIDGQEVWQWTLEGLKPDEDYIVTEFNARDVNGHLLRGDHNLSYTISVDGVQKVSNTFVEGDLTTLPKVQVTVGEGKTVTVHFHNNMTRKVGTLEIEKAFMGLPSVPRGMTMTVTATEVAANGALIANAPVYTLNMVYNETAGTYTASQELPVGYYKLEETISGIVPGYTHQHYVFTQGNAELRNNIVQVTEGNTNAALTLTNHYHQDMGRIRVHKLFAGEDVSELFKDKNIEIDVMQNGQLVETLVLNDDTEWAATSMLLPVGDYQLLEKRSTTLLDDYVLQVNWEPHNTVTVGKDSVVAVHVTNTYIKEEEVGYLTIEKKFTGLDSALIPAEMRVIVTATMLDENGYEAYPLTQFQFQLDPTNEPSVTRTLPVGKYHLVEDVYSGDIEDYVQVGAEFIVDGAVLADDIVTIAKDANVKVELNNSYLEEDDAATLTIPVTKKVEVEGAYKPGRQTFTFAFTMQKPNAKAGVSLMVNIDGKNEMMRLNERHTFTIATNGGGEFAKNIVIHGLESELEGLVVKLSEVAPVQNEDWVYDTTVWTVAQDTNGIFKFETDKGVTADKVTFVNSYNGFSQVPVTVKIPFSKTVVQTGTADPGVNTFYISVGTDGSMYDISVHNDPLNKYGKVEVVERGQGYVTFAVTVNGANKVSGYIEVTGKTADLPFNVWSFELNGKNGELNEDELKALGWTYDVTTFPVMVKEPDGSVYNIWCDWNALVDKNKKVSIFRTDAPNSAKSEMAFVNTYSANLPVAEPPKTGDNSNIALWIALMGMSAVGAVLVIKRRKAC